MNDPDPTDCPVVRPSRSGSGDGSPTFLGICDTNGGARHLSMQLVQVPPGAVAPPHLHAHHETIVYLLSGHVEYRWGDRLEHSVSCQPGDFILTPPGVVHSPRNMSDVDPVYVLAARSDPSEAEATIPVALPLDTTG